MRFMVISVVFVAFATVASTRSAQDSKQPAAGSPANVHAIPLPFLERKNMHLRSWQNASEEDVFEDIAARRNLHDGMELPIFTVTSDDARPWKKTHMLSFLPHRDRVIGPDTTLLFAMLFTTTLVVGFILAFDGYRLEPLLYFSFGFIVGVTWGDTLDLGIPKLTKHFEELGFAFTAQGVLIGLVLGAAMALTRKTINAFGSGLLGMFVAQVLWNVVPFGERGGHHLENLLRVGWLLLGFFLAAHFAPHLASLATTFLCSIFGGFLLAYCINIVFGFARGSNLIQEPFAELLHKVMRLNVGDIRDVNEDESIFLLIWGCITILGFLSQQRTLRNDYAGYTSVNHW